MPTLLRTYDPKAVAIAWNGININSGIAEGTFLTVERDEDSFFKYVGSDGSVARTRNANRSGSIELTLMYNSEVNKLLMAQALLDEREGAEITNVFSVVDPADPTGTFLMVAKDCWIKKIPGQEYAKEYGTKTWMFDVASLSINDQVNDIV